MWGAGVTSVFQKILGGEKLLEKCREEIRRESSGGMEWLGVWNCIFLGSEFSKFGAWNLAKIALWNFRDFPGHFGLLKIFFGLWKMAIPYATNPYPH